MPVLNWVKACLIVTVYFCFASVPTFADTAETRTDTYRIAARSKPAQQPVAARRWQVTTAPFAHVRFCMENADQCVRRGVSIRKRYVAATPARMLELAQVNREVNRAIRPSEDFEGPLGDLWTIAPAAGDCDDYAVTKRARLLARGWPSNALLLTMTQVGSAAHLVLTVRMKGREVVLDNLAAEPRVVQLDTMALTTVQSPVDPTLWLKPAPDLYLAAAAGAPPA